MWLCGCFYVKNSVQHSTFVFDSCCAFLNKRYVLLHKLVSDPLICGTLFKLYQI